MANYYTKFSIFVSLPDEGAQKYALELASKARQVQQDDKPADDLPASLKDVIEDWQFETEVQNGRCALWLHSDYGGIDAVCCFIQHLLQKFNPKGRVGLEWSNDCSSPRGDAYGGGAAIITAKKIKSINTHGWLLKNGA